MALIHAQAGTTASNNREYAASETAFQAALEIYEARLGDQHGATLSAMNNLGVLHLRTGELQRAEEMFRELIEISVEKYGSNHRSVADRYQNLGTAIGRQGRFAEAVPFHRKAYEIFTATIPGHFMTAYPLISIAYAELQSGEPASAERAARQAIEVLGPFPTNVYAIGVAKCLAALALEGQGAGDESAALLTEAQADLAGLRVAPIYQAACRL